MIYELQIRFVCRLPLNFQLQETNRRQAAEAGNGKLKTDEEKVYNLHEKFEVES